MGKPSTTAPNNAFWIDADAAVAEREGTARTQVGHWWRCYTDLPRHRKLARLPDDRARWAWVTLLCAAADANGVFESDSHIELMIGAQYAKYVPYFRRVGLLDGLVVHDWDQWQETTDEGRPEREKRAAAARKRYETMGTADKGSESVVRSMREWLEYVVTGPNTQGRVGEFMAAQCGFTPQNGDYGRIAKLLKTFPGGIPALMTALCEAALRDVKGDPLAYVTRIGSGRKPVGTRSTSRDGFIES